MKRLAIRFAVVLLTFAIGILAAYLFHKLHIQFEPTAMGSIHTKQGGCGGFTAYNSFDGVNLSFEHVSFPSHEAAVEAFRNNLREAARILERKPLYNRKGEAIVGERVVAVFPPSNMAKTEWASVISLDDTKLYQISSPSLRHVLAFDKTHRRY